MMTYQGVFNNNVLTDSLEVNLLVVAGMESLSLEFETVHDPKPDILL